MSYQVLARKWRPANFREMAGQEHVLKALINALDSNRLHQAWLFTGTRGVGKTTIARILAKCLNCEQGVSSSPCGSCEPCTAIAEGRFVDVIEIDAASRTKVEDTREMLDNVQYMPTRGRFKVYLIDEVHMLSQHSFNALLKTLEEPPEHVKFLLATTDPQKLPPTVLSRCLQFNLKNLTPQRIVTHLQEVLAEEKVPFDDPALWLLATAAQGSMRDALSLTDQAIAFGTGELREADIQQMLGGLDKGLVLGLLRALLAADVSALLAAVQQSQTFGADPGAILDELLSVLHKLALLQAAPAYGNDQGDPLLAELAEIAPQVAAEDVQLYYQIGLAGKRDLGYAPDPVAGLEMILLRMLAFRPAGVPVAPAAGAVQPQPATDPPVKKPEAAAPSGDTPPQSEQPRTDTGTELKAPAAGPAVAAASITKAETAGSSAPSEAGKSSVAESGLGEAYWRENFSDLELPGVLASVFSHAELLELSGGCLKLQLDEGHSGLFDRDQLPRLEEHLQRRFGHAIKVEVTVGAVSGQTPAMWRAQIKAGRLAAAREQLYADNVVSRLIEEFDATIDEASIRLIDPSEDKT